eukprot:143356_1
MLESSHYFLNHFGHTNNITPSVECSPECPYYKSSILSMTGQTISLGNKYVAWKYNSDTVQASMHIGIEIIHLTVIAGIFCFYPMQEDTYIHFHLVQIYFYQWMVMQQYFYVYLIQYYYKFDPNYSHDACTYSRYCSRARMVDKFL